MTTGTLYLLCFDKPVAHALHYLGFTTRTVDDRVREHVDGLSAGSALVARAGGGTVTRTWPNATRRDERRLKDRHNLRGVCPRCKPEYNEDCRENVARSRQRRKDRARRQREFTGQRESA